jgi:hypothetical protein
MTAVTSGGCLCGACRYTTEATAINVRACHCRTCQKASGAAVYARVLVPREGLLLAGPVGWYNSSDEVRRGFCTRCGSTMFSERISQGVIGLTLATLDEPHRFQPVEHVWVSEMQPWLRLGDGLPHHAKNAPSSS